MLEPLPFAPMNGFTPEQLSSHLARVMLLSPGCLLLGVALGPYLARLQPVKLNGRQIALVGALFVSCAAAFVFRGVPTQDDEPTYLYQGRLLSDGHIMEPPTPPDSRWGEPFTIFTHSGTTGKYLFGEPLVLALGYQFEVPIAGHVSLVALTLFWVFAAARRAADIRVAMLGALLLAISPEFVFTSALPVSELAALAGLAAAVWGLATGGYVGGMIVGTGLGFSLVTRPQVAVPCGATLLITAIWKDRRIALAAALTAGPWLLSLALYNAAVTGSMKLFPMGSFGVERYGFGRPFIDNSDHVPYIHTMSKGIAHAGVALTRLNGWALGWPLSIAGPITWVALGLPSRRAIAPWGWIAFATFLFQVGYYSAGTSDTGAIYHFAVLPFFALSTSAAIDALCATRWRQATIGCAAVLMLFGTGSFYLEHAARLRRLTDAIAAPFRSLDVPIPALVFVETAPAGRPPVGWISGLPFRERSAHEAVLFYPRTGDTAVEELRHRWPGRACRYLYHDYSDASRHIEPCERMQELSDAFRDATEEGNYVHVEAPHGPVPRWAKGGWRLAFPWLPGIGRCENEMQSAPFCR